MLSPRDLMILSWKYWVQFSVLALAVAAGWLEYEQGPELVRRFQFGTTPTPEVQAAMVQADAAAKQAEIHASRALRNQALAREAAAGARDAAQKARKGVRGYASQSPIKEQGATLYGYEGQVDRNGSPEGLQVVNFGEGASYEGGWKQGVPEGYGVMTYSGGRVHTGKWVHGVNVGDGITVTAGVSWEGELVGSGSLGGGYWGVLLCDAGEACQSQAGLFEITASGEFNLNGASVVAMRDGRQLKGIWQHGVRAGYGVVLDARGGMLEQGNYRNGRL
ncbi:MAG TPA: hypothetical protein VNW15_07810 [Rhizomicrobium sp.]|nr:hypothetical protein [Rhizomicrobium sp.]